MKKTLLNLLIVTGLFLLYSCSGGESYSEEEEDAATDTTEVAEVEEETDMSQGFIAATVTHDVADYDAWRVVFDEETAENENIMGVYQSADNPNTVMVTEHIESHDGYAEGFESEEMKAVLDRAGVTSELDIKTFDVLPGEPSDYEQTTRWMVSHEVADFDAWKTIFDEHQSKREENGIYLIGMARFGDNPNKVLLWFAVDDMDQAKSFMESDDLKSTMETAGVNAESIESSFWTTTAAPVGASSE